MPRHQPSTRVVGSLLAALLLAAGTACSASGGLGGDGSGNRRATPPLEATRPAGTPGGPQAASRAGVMSSMQLRVAYRTILERFVDPVEPAQLINVARDGLRESLRQQPLLPMFTLPLDLPAVSSGDPEKDWAAFGEGYDATVQKLPAWAEQSQADWLVIRRMVESLADGHSAFLTPEEVRRRAETSFGGVGISLTRSDQGPIVTEVFPSSPAAAAGLRRGDRIVEVDGQPLAGRPLADAVQMIRGPRGTEVRLAVRRAGASRPLEVRLTRAQVSVDAVLGGLSANRAGLGYLKVRTFSDEAPDQAARVLGVGTSSDVRGWIVDLRANTGGSLAAVLQIAGAFLGPDAEVGFEVNRQGEHSRLVADGTQVVQDVPLVVLVDRDTASGAEILAAALRERRGARIVGLPTAGNVGVATLVPLPDGSALQITERRYLTSSGGAIEKSGIQPDVVVEVPDADLEAGRDPQLQRAGEILAGLVGG